MADALPTPERVVVCRPDVPRAEDNAVLADVFVESHVETQSAVTDALDAALDTAVPVDCVLVCGSLYTVREARTRWSRLDIPKEIDGVDDTRWALKGTHVTDAGTYRMHGKAVHRALKTRVRPRQAQYLKEELLSLGGEFDTEEAAVRRAEEMVAEGVDIIDVGGESTRPGVEPVSIEDERERVVPVVKSISEFDALVSVDTRKAAVARTAPDAGADIINDISGLADPEMRFVAADYDCPLVVMHSIDTPVDPVADIEYDDVVVDTIHELRERVLLAEKARLDREQIIVDPGIGFGKCRRENFAVLGRLGEFRALDCPILFGHSHKSMFDLGGSAAIHYYNPIPIMESEAFGIGSTSVVNVDTTLSFSLMLDKRDLLPERQLQRHDRSGRVALRA